VRDPSLGPRSYFFAKQTSFFLAPSGLARDVFTPNGLTHAESPLFRRLDKVAYQLSPEDSAYL